MFQKPDWVGNSLEYIELNLEDMEKWLKGIVFTEEDEERRKVASRCLGLVQATKFMFELDPADISRQDIIKLTTPVNRVFSEFNLVINEKRPTLAEEDEEEG